MRPLPCVVDMLSRSPQTVFAVYESIAIELIPILAFEEPVHKLPDLEGEKDFNDDHREDITDLVQSIPGFPECDEEDAETYMACDAED
ncbi:hypothetical protein TNCV_2814711 [Trichonephila clavipes]|nr:hypothetical protein TNCV_2814711 [Trichonephila clavipes]